MSPGDDLRERVRRRFPRVSGDEPFHALEVNHTAGFSPRERG